MTVHLKDHGFHPSRHH